MARYIHAKMTRLSAGPLQARYLSSTTCCCGRDSTDGDHGSRLGVSAAFGARSPGGFVHLLLQRVGALKGQFHSCTARHRCRAGFDRILACGGPCGVGWDKTSSAGRRANLTLSISEILTWKRPDPGFLLKRTAQAQRQHTLTTRAPRRARLCVESLSFSYYYPGPTATAGHRVSSPSTSETCA